MRTIRYFAAIAALGLAPVGVWAQQNQSGSAASGSAAGSAQAAASNSAANPASTPQDSLAAAARRAKEQKAAQTKPTKVFTNDNLPTTGVISTVGSTSSGSANTDNGTATSAPAGQGEKYWRDKFADLRKKLDQDQAELDVDQREMGVTNVQYYSDPVKGMQQGLTRSDVNQKAADIEAKKKAVAADQQAISDAEDALRKSGGDSGWAR